MKRIVFIWRAIEDAIILATPDLIGEEVPELFWGLWRTILYQCAYSIDNATAIWKRFTLHMKHLFTDSRRRNENPYPRELPFGLNGTLAPIWYNTLTWLRISLTESHKNERKFFERLGILVQYRNHPPPGHTVKRMNKEVKAYCSILQRKFKVEEKYAQALGVSAEKISSICRRRDVVGKPHVSLSFSGDFLFSREKGGKAIRGCKAFLDKYVKRAAAIDKIGLTLWVHLLF
jgi:hypothetical protein